MFLRDTKTTHIAQNLKEYRISHNLKQTEMADLLKMNYQNYSKMERGVYQPSLDKLLEICDILMLTPNDLLQEGRSFDEYKQEYIEKFMSICTYINDHCTEDLSIEKLAARAGFSKYHFSRLFKQFTGVSCYEYLISRRIAYAERLLLTPNLSITEVAMQSGFNSLSTFNRIFKTAKNCTPSSYKSLNRGTRLDTAGSPD